MNTKKHFHTVSKIAPVLLSLVFLIISTSCNSKKKQAQELMNVAESLIEENPDSALVLLDSIHYPENLGKEQYAEYVLLNTQARDKAYKDISSDTLIFKIRDYYESKKNHPKIALSYFYCGRVFQSDKKYLQAMEAYLRAETETHAVNDTSNNNLKGLIHYFIGLLNYNQHLYADAIESFKQSIEDFKKNPDNFKKEIAVLNLIGNSFLITQQNDSAFYFFNKGLQLAQIHKDSSFTASIKKSLGVAYREIGDYSKAKNCMQEVLAFETDDDERSKTYLNIAKLYDVVGPKDSAVFYVNKALDLFKKCDNTKSLFNAYKLLSKIEEDKKNYKQALIYHQQYSKYIISSTIEINKQSLLEIQKKYSYELIQNRNNQLQIEKQRIYFLILFLIIIAIIIYFLLYRKHVQKKDALLQANQQIHSLKTMAESFNAKENTLRNEVLHHFDIIKKVAVLNEKGLVNSEKANARILLNQVNQIVYGQKEGFNWKIFFNSINALHDGIEERLKQAFPQLDETELKICYLSYAGFGNTEMATLLGLALNTIQQKKSIIRKKIGIPEHGNFHDFFSKHLDNRPKPSKDRE